MGDFMPATVEGYSTWPKGSQHYWALPAMGDAVAWTYRKDGSQKPELQKGSRPSSIVTSRRIDVGRAEQVAQFFSGPHDRRQEGSTGGGFIPSAGSEGITNGFTKHDVCMGMEYDKPEKPYEMKGFINGADAVRDSSSTKIFTTAARHRACLTRT